ncbi:MAG: hypothetical protein J7497_04205, partial [Chitinophagaceae bacterium]|nr:hypothetical protein [Chitinophagaceae bacterium]
NKIDFTSHQSTAISFSHTMGWDFTVILKKHKGKFFDYTDDRGTGGDLIIELLLKYFYDIEYFICFPDTIASCIFSQKKTNPSNFTRFTNYCINNIIATKREKRNSYEYTISPDKKLSNRDFFEITESCGWINELNLIIGKLIKLAEYTGIHTNISLV